MPTKTSTEPNKWDFTTTLSYFPEQGGDAVRMLARYEIDLDIEGPKQETEWVVQGQPTGLAKLEGAVDSAIVSVLTALLAEQNDTASADTLEPLVQQKWDNVKGNVLNLPDKPFKASVVPESGGLYNLSGEQTLQKIVVPVPSGSGITKRDVIAPAREQAQSNSENDWTQPSIDFKANASTAPGQELPIGLSGDATVSFDIPVEELIEIKEVDFGPLTPEVTATPQPDRLGDGPVNPNEAFNMPIALNNQSQLPAKVEGPNGEVREVEPDDPILITPEVDFPEPDAVIEEAVQNNADTVPLPLTLDGADETVLTENVVTAQVPVKAPNFQFGEVGTPDQITPDESFDLTVPVEDTAGVSEDVVFYGDGLPDNGVQKSLSSGAGKFTLRPELDQQFVDDILSQSSPSIQLQAATTNGFVIAETSVPADFLPSRTELGLSGTPTTLEDPADPSNFTLRVPIEVGGNTPTYVEVRNKNTGEVLWPSTEIDPNGPTGGETNAIISGLSFPNPDEVARNVAQGGAATFPIEVDAPDAAVTPVTAEPTIPVDASGGEQPEPSDPPEFRILSDTAETVAPPQPGDPAEVRFDVENVGDAVGTADLSGPGTGDKDKEIPPGDTATFDLDVDPSQTDAEYSVSPAAADSSPLTVDAPSAEQPESPPDFGFGDIPEPSGPLAPGESVSLDVPVDNDGESGGEAVLTAPATGEEKRGNVPAGGQTVFTFSPTPSELESSFFDITLSGDGSRQTTSVDLPGVERDDGDDETTASDGWELVDMSAPSSIKQGDKYDISATVRNTADQSRDAEFTLRNEKFRRTRSVSAGGEETYTRSFTTQEAGTIERTFVLQTPDGAEEILSATRSIDVAPRTTRETGGLGPSGTWTFQRGNDEFGTSQVEHRLDAVYIESGETVVEGEVERFTFGGGGLFGDSVIELEVNGETDKQTVSWPSGGPRSFTLRVEEIGQPIVRMWQGGKFDVPDDIADTFAGVKTFRLDQPPRPEPLFLVDGVRLPDVADIGESIPVEIDVLNDGAGEGDATLIGPRGTQTQTIGSGETETFTLDFSFDSTGFQPIELTLRDDTDGETKQITRNVDVQAPRFDLVSLVEPSPLEPGEQYEVGAEVRNTGDAPGDVSVSIGDAAPTRTLAPGESATVTRQRSYSSGTQSVPIEVRNLATDEVVATDEVSITPATPTFDITDTEVPEEVAVGDAAEVAVTVVNSGGVSGDATAISDSRERQATLSPSETRTFTFDIQTDSPTTVSTPAEIVNEDTGDVAAQRSFTTNVVAPKFSLGQLSPPENPPVGEEIEVAIPVENTGNAAGAAEVQVDGTARTTQQLAPGETDTATHRMTIREAGVAPLDIAVRNTATGEIDDTSSTAISPGTPSFTIRSFDVPAEAAVGEIVTGEVRIANDGEVPATAQVVAGLNTKQVRLSPGEERAVTFDISKSSTPTQQVDVTVTAVEANIAPTTRRATISSSEDGQQPPEPEPPTTRPPRRRPDPPEDDDFGDLLEELLDPLDLFGDSRP